MYIHIPFCRKKCNYCDFVSYPGREDRVDAYLEAVIKEMELRSRVFDPGGPDTIYVGGGTPSVLSAGQLELLFSAVYGRFDCGGLCEATLEGNPESLDEDKLKALKRSNVNRLSIGLQSFSDVNLKVLGRVHDLERFLKTYDTARKSSFDNINIDLIYGIPGQSLSVWEEELSKAADLSPEHLSVYALTVENKTEFSSRGLSVDEDLQAQMYEYAEEYLGNAGYVHYELSNFARKGRECRHNLIYWDNGPYLGIGAGAVSYISGVRSRNTASIDDYIEGISDGRLPVIEREKLEGVKKSSERLMLGLRLEQGVELTAEEGVFKDKLESLRDMELVENYSGDCWKLTRRGRLLANCVFREIL